MFTVDDRRRLRGQLVRDGRADARVTAAALVGSAAVGREDAWSDIDLALCISADADPGEVIEEWTDRMYREHSARRRRDGPAHRPVGRLTHRRPRHPARGRSRAHRRRLPSGSRRTPTAARHGSPSARSGDNWHVQWKLIAEAAMLLH